MCSTTWFAERWPGSWQYFFCDSEAQGKIILERIVAAAQHASPWLVVGMVRNESSDVILANYSRIAVGGVGKRVRTVHPDRIVGDHVLNEQATSTEFQRSKTAQWWSETVGGMAHTGLHRRGGWRKLRTGEPTRYFRPTTIRLMGTAFHQNDLLMAMRKNPIYRFVRYSAAFNPNDLVPGTTAVEMS